jgi:integrase
MALTKTAIDRLEYDRDGPKMQIEYDGAEIPGFGVRVHPTGRKTFVLTYRAPGRPTPRRIVLGTYGQMTLDEARKEARKTLLEAKTGDDPLEARRKLREGDTVRDLARTYLERYAKREKKTWKEDERRLESYILPALGAKRIADVRRPDVARLHDRIGRRAPYEANRVLALLSVMFTKAQEFGLLEEGAANPAARVPKRREKSRDRWITREELPALVAAIDAEPSVYVRAAIKLYLLTGMRRGELLGLRWRDVDLERREIRLGDTKAGRAHVVPLSAEALDVLGTLPRGIGKAFVFPSERTQPGEEPKPLVNINKPWSRIRARFWLGNNPAEAAKLRERAARDVARRSKHAEKSAEAIEARLVQLAQAAAKGEEDVRLHDLRRTVGSWLATAGASLPLIGKVLNHSNASTTQVYARLAEDPARAALEEHGARIGPLLIGEARAQ